MTALGFFGCLGFPGFLYYDSLMSDAFIDSMPSHERGRWERLKLRSPGEYEKLRKAAREHGPAFAEREMKHNAEFAEMKFALETDSKAQEQARDVIKKAASEDLSLIHI